MKAATINELKTELQHLQSPQLVELCLRLAKFKKESKELLTYLLFEAADTENYVKTVKQEMDTQFEDINKSNAYFIKKTVRKILRLTNKYSRYSGLANVQIELLIHFCTKMKPLINGNTVLNNIYQTQQKNIHKAIGTLHEDLQYDYLREMEKF
jgi:hypothetical protein